MPLAEISNLNLAENKENTSSINKTPVKNTINKSPLKKTAVNKVTNLHNSYFFVTDPAVKLASVFCSALDSMDSLHTYLRGQHYNS